MSLETKNRVDIATLQPRRTKIAFFTARTDINDLDEIYVSAKTKFSVQVFDSGNLRTVYELMKWSFEVNRSGR